MLLENYRLVAMPQAKWARLALDPDKCNGCGRCVNACPVQLLMVDENKKTRSNERYDVFRCLTCENCAAACPEGAITIEDDYRVPRGFWKNTHLYSGTKTPPAPLGEARGANFDEYQDELTETERVIYLRRSNRLYKKKQVDPGLVERIIEAGRFAPSAGNNQPWRFLVVQNPEILEDINQQCKKTLRSFAKLCMPKVWLDKKAPGDKTARLERWQKVVLWLLVNFVGGDADQRAHGGVNAVTSDPDYHTFFRAPTLILLLVDKRAIGGTQLDMGICGQTMVLAAHSLGLGTCYVDLITKTLAFNRGLRRKLGIAHPFEIATVLAIGHPRGKTDGIVHREQPRIEWMT
jgi:nitroreductase/NAD-dependent dihydropyrimidine dehydrogenase PreA subunit